MHLHVRSPKCLADAAAIAAAAALIPVAALAATVAPAVPAAAATPLGLLASGPGQAAKVPAGFQPASASFYSPASGVVLGAVGCRPQQACQARLAATTDGGARWRFLRTPDVRVSGIVSAGAVSGVVFASRRDGWLYDQYGPGLWATHDRSAHWRKLSLGGAIESVAASSGIVYAMVAPHGDTRPWELFASPAGQDAWARVGRMTAGQASLAVAGQAAWFGSSTHLWATADGEHWHRYPFRCPGPGFGLAGIAAASASHVVFLCGGNPGAGSAYRELLRSANGGRTTHLAGPAQLAAVSDAVAVPPGRTQVITIAASGGNGVLYRSANDGKSWKGVFTVIGGAFWSSLSFVSRNVGWFVVNEPATTAPGTELLRTSDAGATWRKVGF